MKLKQVNEGFKCPKCKKFSIVKHHGEEWIAEDTIVMYDYICKNCNAKFIDEKKYLKGGGNKDDRTKAR